MEMTIQEKTLLQQCLLFQELSMEEIIYFLKESHSYCKILGKGEMLFYEEEKVEQIGIL